MTSKQCLICQCSSKARTQAVDVAITDEFQFITKRCANGVDEVPSEARLPTKHGEFNIRVFYESDTGHKPCRTYYG